MAEGVEGDVGVLEVGRCLPVSVMSVLKVVREGKQDLFLG